MAIQLMGLPQLRIQEQGLDAAPLTRAIQGYTAGSDAATQFANTKAVGQTAATGDLKAAARQAMGLGETDLGMQYQQRATQDEATIKKRLGSMAQAVEMEADPNRRNAMWQRVLKMVPGGATNLAPEEMDPMTGPKMLMAEAGIVVDPLERQQKQGALQLQQAQIGKLNREAAMGGEMPSNVREWQYFQSLPPEKQQQYLTMKRAEKYLDTGTAFVRPNPVDPANPIASMPKDVAGTARQKELGEAGGKAAADLPRVLDNAALAIQTLDQIRNHPGKQYGIGAAGVIPGIPGTQQRGFVNLVEQAKGKTFLEAFNSLKGGGQITEAEGQKATQALARLDRAQTPEDFEQSLADLEQVIRLGASRAKNAAGGGPRQQSAPQNDGWQDLGNGIRIREKR